VLTVAPSYVTTRMIDNLKPDIFAATSKDCVKGALKELGRGEFTYGSWRHNLKFNLFDAECYRK